MPTDLVILHLSDIHCSDETNTKLQDRVNALIADVKTLDLRPDMIVLTGDISYSGQANQFVQVRKNVIDPLCKALKITPSQVLLVPGNHDVERGRIDIVAEEELRSETVKPKDVLQLIMDEDRSISRLANYYDFVSDYWGCKVNVYCSRTVEARNINIGVGCLNSSWRSSSLGDKGYLYIGEKQIQDTSSKIARTNIRIAISHHPLEYLHESEWTTSVCEIDRCFDLWLSGHLHVNNTESVTTPSSSIIRVSAPAFYDDEEVNGYNIYRLDLLNNKVHAHFRMYATTRHQYDLNTLHAQNGYKEYELPPRNGYPFGNNLLAVNITNAYSANRSELTKMVCQRQKGDNFIIVKPDVRLCTYINGKKRLEKLKGSIIDDLTDIAIVYGPKESGKSILMRVIAEEIISKALDTDEGIIPEVIDAKRHTIEEVVMMMSNSYDQYYAHESSAPSGIVFLIDGIDCSPRYIIEQLPTFITEHKNARVILATSNPFMNETLAAANSPFQLFELNYWGPERIKQVVERKFDGTNISTAAAYRFVLNSIRESDIPPTPFIILLYLEMFSEGLEGLTSISFVRLLEKYEDLQFGQVERSPADSLYYKSGLLSKLAAELYSRDEPSIDLDSFKGLINKHFDVPGIPYDQGSFLESLLNSGIIRIVDSQVSFSCLVFSDFYLAKSIKEGIISRQSLTSSLVKTISACDALAHYGGLCRGDLSLVYDIFNHIEKVFRVDSNIDLSSLDSYITDLLIPSVPEDKIEEVISEDLNTEVDIEQEEEQFEKSRDYYVARRNSSIESLDAEKDSERVILLFRSLLVFYKVFRNLEQMDKADKSFFIDLILDYHIKGNILLIEMLAQYIKRYEQQEDESNRNKYRTIGEIQEQHSRRHRARNLVAYMSTIGGINLLCSTIGNQTLRRSIEIAIESTNNDFKKTLLVMLLADLRTTGFEQHVVNCAKSLNSRAGIELLYIKLRLMMIDSKKGEEANRIKTAFTEVVRKRVLLQDEKAKPKEINEKMALEMRDIDNDRVIFKKDRHMDA